MLAILIILVCIGLGMAVGARRRKNAALLLLADKASLCAVHALLFVLGARLGRETALLETLPLLGARALCIACLCMAGSVLCLSFAGRFLLFPESAAGRTGRTAEGPSPLRGSLRILACFAGGILLSLLSLSPAWIAHPDISLYFLYFLVFAVGIGLGADARAFRILRVMHVRILSVPLLVIGGSGLGALLAACLLPGMTLRDTLSVGAGLGYYSLSSILIESSGNSALASTALVSNIAREILAILAAPLLARHCGRLSTVGAAGATAMDTTLPVIARFSGEHAAVVAVFSGMVLTLLVPFLVTAALQLQS
jgi:uncharacterized membrane protein YbjE (DUF340 family)